MSSTTQLEKHLKIMEMNSDHREVCQCYICLGKKLASEMSGTLQQGNTVKWSTEDFAGGFFKRLKDQWFR